MAKLKSRPEYKQFVSSLLMSHAGGRPSKLPKCSARFLKHIETGHPIAAAAALSGLAQSTVFAWLAAGKKTKTGDFPEFLEAFTRARGKAQGKMVEQIRKAGREDWRAIGWLLERMFPEQFSLKQLHEVSGLSTMVNVAAYAGGPPADTRSPQEVKEELLRLQRAIWAEAKRQEEQGDGGELPGRGMGLVS